jgi:U3 small nucleolar RNA-associated protein 22
LLSIIPSLLNRGLTDRVNLIASHSDSFPSWKITSEPPKNNPSEIFVGLSYNPVECNRLVDQGPPAEDTEAATNFRRIWGNKAELRKFKDSSIIECAVWENVTDKTSIIREMVCFLLERHFRFSSKTDFTFWGDQFNVFVKHPEQPQGLSTMSAFKNLIASFDSLSRMLKTLQDVPLNVLNVLPSHAALRYSSVFVPNSHSSVSADPLEEFVCPMDVTITFESSINWPDDLVAIQHTKTAFYIQMAQSVEAEGKYKVVVASEKLQNPIEDGAYMDILTPEGFVFRCRIHHEREGVLLRQAFETSPSYTGTDSEQSEPTPECPKDYYKNALDLYERLYVKSPQHTLVLQSLCQTFPSLSLTIRLVKRWIASHALSAQIPDELLELVCCRVYVHPAPYYAAPSSGWSGFMRVLNLFAHFDWKNEPMVVDVEVIPSLKSTSGHASETLGFFERAKQNFNVLRGSKETAKNSLMFMATRQDEEGTWWGWNQPSAMSLLRLRALSKASLSHLTSTVRRSTDSDTLKVVFKTPEDDYPIKIYLNQFNNPRRLEDLQTGDTFVGVSCGLNGPQKNKKKAKSKYKNIQVEINQMEKKEEDVEKQRWMIGFDPVSLYVQELKELYGQDYAIFYNQYGGSWLGMVPRSKQKVWLLSVYVVKSPVNALI